VAFSLAANFTNYDTAYWAHKLSEGSGFWTVTPPSSDQMKKARYFEHAKVSQPIFPQKLLVLKGLSVDAEGLG
jgi:rhomboid-like protein